MAKKLRVDVEINAVINTSAEKLDKVAQEMQKIQTNNTPGTTQKEIDEYKRISTEISHLKETMEKDLSTGAAQTPATLQAYNTALDAQEKALREVTNQSMIALAGDKEFEDQLKKSTANIDAYEQSLKDAAVQLEALKTQTEQVTKAEENAAEKLGISVSSIDTDDKIQEEIKKRSTDGGRAKKNEKENIQVLQKILDLKQKLLESEGNILQEKEKVINKMREEEALLSNEKELREKIMLDQVELMKKKEGKGKNAKSKITEEQAAQITSNIKLGRSFDEVRKSVKGVTLKKLKSEIEGNTQATRAGANANDKKKKSFFENIKQATLYYAAIRTLRRLMRQTVRTVTELDKSFTQIAMVTGMTRKESWALLGSYQGLAKEVGTTTDQVAKLGVYFARQGRSASEAMQLTKTAALAAKVASIDAEKSANFLTSAINGFGLAIDQSMAISDKFAALGASSASSYEEMAIALSKVAPVAKTAGVGIDIMMAFLAKGIETTREAPENIGTAFKTVFARMTQLRDFGATLEEGVGVNTVEDALATAGVALRDNQGNFRNMDQVLVELGHKFEGLSRNQQAYIATALAGTRQQSRLLAVMQNFDRTMELVDISTESAGATLAQHAAYSKGMEAANARLTTSFQEVITSLINSEVVIAVVNLLANAISRFSKVAKVLAFTMGTLITAILIYHALIKKTIVLTGKEGAVTASINIIKQVYTVITGKATIATMGLGKAIGIATGGITIILGVLAMLITGLFDTDKAGTQAAESIRDIQASLYNMSKETKDFNALIDRFDQLDKKIFKTAEDMREMESILDKIKEHGGSEFDFVLAGRLDKDVIDAYLKQQEDARKEAEGDLRMAGATALNKVFQDRMNREERNMPMQEAFKNRFENLTKEEKEATKELIMSTYEGYADMTRDEKQKLAKLVEDDFFNLSFQFFNKAAGSGVFKIGAWFKKNRITDDGEGQIREGGLEQSNSISDKLNEFFDDFDKVVKGEVEGQRASEIFSRYFELDPADQRRAQVVYSDQIGSLLNLGEQTVTRFLRRGHSFSAIQSMVSSLEDGLKGVTQQRDGVDVGVGGEIANFYAEAFSRIDPNNIQQVRTIVDHTLDYIRENADNAEVAMKKFIGSITDPMAFQNALNIFKSTASTVTSLIDASENYQKGRVDDKLLSLVSEYPDLAEDIRNGTLDMANSIDIMVRENIKQIELKLLDLERQLSVETDDRMKSMIQAQIDTLKDMVDKESFLYGGIAEQFKVKETEKVSKRFKEQIDFIKKYNQEQQKEIDLIEKKLRLNQSMLSLDRQITALARDTSYGAQARSRDLQEQKRSAAVEREKLVMDLVTEQAISELEKERDKHIAGIADNVQQIVDMAKTRSVRTSNAFSSTTGNAGGGEFMLLPF